MKVYKKNLDALVEHMRKLEESAKIIHANRNYASAPNLSKYIPKSLNSSRPYGRFF